LYDSPNNINIWYITISLLIIWILALPLTYIIFRKFVANTSRKFKNGVDNNYYKRIFSFMCEEYKPKYHYWEILKMINLKILIILVDELFI
jgi:hypothetical protein